MSVWFLGTTCPASCDEKLIIKLWQNCKVVKVFVICLSLHSLRSFSACGWAEIIINNLKAGCRKAANSSGKNRKPKTNKQIPFRGFLAF